MLNSQFSSERKKGCLQPVISDNPEGAFPGALLPGASDEALIRSDILHESVDDDLHGSTSFILGIRLKVKFPRRVCVGYTAGRRRQLDVLHRRRIGTGVQRTG